MYDIDNCIRKEGQKNGHGEQIENSFDVPRKLGFVGGHTSSSLREWSPSRAEILRFMLASFPCNDCSVSHEGHNKEDKKKDWVKGAQVFQQLNGCMGIHCPLNIPEMSVFQTRSMTRESLERVRKGGFGKDRTGMAKIDASNGNVQCWDGGWRRNNKFSTWKSF